MWIKLDQHNGPPIWFLGEPKKVKVSLTYQQPGPETIEFEKLSELEQKQILIGIQKKTLESDKSYMDLYNLYLQGQPKEEAPSQEVQTYLNKKKEKKVEKKQLSVLAKREKQEQKFKSRCEHISKQTTRAIKAAIKNEDDLRLLRTLLQMELKNKNRISVKDLLQEHIRKIQKEISIGIEKATTDKPISLGTPREMFPYEILESESQVVHFASEAIANKDK